MNTIQTQNDSDLLERSRNTILDLGYNLIVYRSKAKKAFAILKRRLTSYYL